MIMKLIGIYNRSSCIVAYNSNRIYSFNVIVNLSIIVAEYLKIKDKLYTLSKNFYSIMYSGDFVK